MNVEDKDPDLDFRQAVTGIKRLTHNRMVSGGRKRRPIPRQSLADETSVLQESLSELPLDVDVESGEQLQYCQAGVKKTVYRRLKRGDFVVQGILDLHGLTIAQAKEKSLPI